MKYKEIKKILALTMALSLAAPANVFAADIQTQADGNQVVEEPETPQQPETPQEPEQPEAPLQETPEQYEQRTGYQLPEGHHYVLDANGYVTFNEDGSIKIEANQPEAPLQETPQQYEERTGYQLPEGHHYVLDANGYVTFNEDGSIKIEANQPEAPLQETPQQYEERTGYQLPEGHHYVLDANGYVTFNEDGSIKIEANQPEAPLQETPQQYEERTGYQLPEGHHYVLDANGYVTFNEDGSIKIEANQPEAPLQETPQQYEERTGYQLPEGYHYVLDENGYVILLDNGSPKIEADDPEAPSSNQELVQQQEIIEVPTIVEDFRFWTVARKYAFSNEKINIYEEMTEEARSVGTLAKKGVCYILKEEEDGWLYVESGAVRGFVKAEDVVTGEEAQKILERYQKEARSLAARFNEEYKGIEGVAPTAKETVPYRENKAFLYLRATVNQTVVDKEYALTTASLLNIREDKNTESRIIGTLEENSLCYVLEDAEEDWVYIESGDVRGFVAKEYLNMEETVQEEVTEKGEDTYTLAKEEIAPEENEACYYTLTSVRSGVPGGQLRSSVVEFASQFIGNPYVWGGTSLTEGADCSGFVQSIFKEYGYELPRVAADQAQYGTKIPVEDAQPGDLIFYAKNGYVYHVVIYAGDGKTVEAMGKDYGIVQGNLNTKNAVWAVRVLEDETVSYGGGDIAEVNATSDMYGEKLGNFKLTYYCSCELCCDVETGITATGTPVVEGRTIAVDPKVIPYGTQVIINGHVFTAEDCGGAIKGNRIDIYVNDHDRANALGVNHADVYLVK